MIALDIAVVATVLAWLTVAAGLSLATCYVRGRHAPRWLLWVHPLAATATLALVWIAVAVWPGSSDLPFNFGAFLITLAFVAGGLMFSLRIGGLRPHVVAFGLHGLVALIGCALLLAGLLSP